MKIHLLLIHIFLIIYIICRRWYGLVTTHTFHWALLTRTLTLLSQIFSLKFLFLVIVTLAATILLEVVCGPLLQEFVSPFVFALLIVLPSLHYLFQAYFHVWWQNGLLFFKTFRFIIVHIWCSVFWNSLIEPAFLNFCFHTWLVWLQSAEWLK